MSSDLIVDPEALRAEVRDKYREVAQHPAGEFHFHTGRPLAARLGYDASLVARLPDRAVESFAGVANPFSLRPLQRGERLVDVGSGGGFDSFIAASMVGRDGRVVGVDMTAEMLGKARSTAAALDLANVEFREGLAERLPVEDDWADVVISNGVFNLCADKRAVFEEVWRVLRPGGVLQFAGAVGPPAIPAAPAIATLLMCSANLPDKIAISVDAQMDDGFATSGTVRAFRQPQPNPALAAGQASQTYAEDGVSTYLVCRQM